MSRWNEGRFVPSMNDMVQSFPWVRVGAVCSCVVFLLGLVLLHAKKLWQLAVGGPQKELGHVQDAS